MWLDYHYPTGREFEQIMFDLPWRDSSYSYGEPYYLPFENSMQQVIKMAWRNYSLALRGKSKGRFYYNPLEPRGEIAHLFELVKQYLPNEVCGEKSGPLNFYVSVGRYSLDRHHKIDGFFWWEGVYFTLDVTTYDKDRYRDSVDCFIRPEDLNYADLHVLAFFIAETLDARRRYQDRKPRFTKGVSVKKTQPSLI